MQKKINRQSEGLHLDIRALRAYLSTVAKAIKEPGRPRACGYLRVSSRMQASEGTSLEAQRESIVRYAVLHGFDLVRIEKDAGISGGKSEEQRPGLAAVLEAVRSGECSVVLAIHVDRLARDLDLAGHLRILVKRAGGRIEIIGAKTDPMGRLFDDIWAEYERQRGADRMRSFHATRKARGLYSGAVPYGMRPDEKGHLEPDPTVAPVVARILRLRGQGASLRGIAQALNADHVPGRTAAAWNAETVRGVVNRNK